MAKAHKIDGLSRTSDISLHEDATFNDLTLSPVILRGLNDAGFFRPSPIQLKAIPLGRCGLDLIVQSKAGTGKTCVFGVIALESLLTDSSNLQVLILSPTREVSLQSQRVICDLGKYIDKLVCSIFIGGVHYKNDLKNLVSCQIAVGTPGRIAYLIKCGYLKTESIRLLVLDEADMLFTENFAPVLNWIYSSLPKNKQVLAVSATYTETLAQRLTLYMKNPTFVRLNPTDAALLGIRQYYQIIPSSHLANIIFNHKLKALVSILSALEFSQCLVFSNFQERARLLCDGLSEKGWPVTYISSSLDQEQRIVAYDRLKNFNCRILVSTDLVSRGVDAENVNVVINLDVPEQHSTYLHRIGRAGRFGSYGCAISLVAEGREHDLLKNIVKLTKSDIKQLPSPIPAELALPVSLPSVDPVSVETIPTDDLPPLANGDGQVLEFKPEFTEVDDSTLKSTAFDKNQMVTEDFNNRKSLKNGERHSFKKYSQEKQNRNQKRQLGGAKSRDDPDFEESKQLPYNRNRKVQPCQENGEASALHGRRRAPVSYDDLLSFQESDHVNDEGVGKDIGREAAAYDDVVRTPTESSSGNGKDKTRDLRQSLLQKLDDKIQALGSESDCELIRPMNGSLNIAAFADPSAKQVGHEMSRMANQLCKAMKEVDFKPVNCSHSSTAATVSIPKNYDEAMKLSQWLTSDAFDIPPIESMTLKCEADPSLLVSLREDMTAYDSTACKYVKKLQSFKSTSSAADALQEESSGVCAERPSHAVLPPILRDVSDQSHVRTGERLTASAQHQDASTDTPVEDLSQTPVYGHCCCSKYHGSHMTVEDGTDDVIVNELLQLDYEIAEWTNAAAYYYQKYSAAWEKYQEFMNTH